MGPWQPYLQGESPNPPQPDRLNRFHRRARRTRLQIPPPPPPELLQDAGSTHKPPSELLRTLPTYNSGGTKISQGSPEEEALPR